MYTGHLFIVTFALLVSSAASEDYILTNINGKSMSMSTDDLCTKAGFVKNSKPNPLKPADPTTTFKSNNYTTTPSPTLGPTHEASTTGNGMSTTDIVLTVLGVTAGVLLLAFLGNYFYKKQKIQ
ncbi:uncharacterized protein LOC133520848 isoform X1 [Cydia pomonella]|uniref:uncharacterized protein LOC133520848 isoform X1 n=1 Tax=Cydia pomonella TaxID=82600 RepID=UPI002ADDD6C5|nr:uncharacterized protein LOC133520848 isoform X1 [Cydia pomonella]